MTVDQRGAKIALALDRLLAQDSWEWQCVVFVRVSEHAWEERTADGTVIATHWTTTKKDRQQQITFTLT